MKDGWSVKKLVEVCEINYGTRVVQKKDGGTIYPVYGGGGATFKMDIYNREDCLVVSRFAMSSQCVRYVRGKFFLNDSGLTVKTDNVCLSQEYLDKCILSLNDKIYSLGKGVAQKNLDMKEFRNLNIHYPISLPEQSRIVEELDLLSNIIEKKRQQLSELDNLAQSIFYDMFGDPLTNEKGWEVKKIKDFANVKIGPFGSLLHNSDYISGGTPLVNPIHMKNEYIYAEENFTISDEKLKELSSYLLQADDIIMARRGDIGRCAIVRKEDDGFVCGTGSLFIRLNDLCISLYLLKVIRTATMIEYLVSKAKGATMLNINCTIVEDLPIPLPPLSLQQLFAQKIEAIEKQKALIKQSIAETEELFNSRMDYYFD